MTGINVKGRFGSGPSIIRFARVTCDGSAGEVDETDSESGGYGECDESGVVQQNITMEGWIRSADGAPWYEGQLVTDLLICWDGNVAAPVVNKRHFFPKAKVLSFQVKGGARDGSVAFTASLKSSGPYKPMGIA